MMKLIDFVRMFRRGFYVVGFVGVVVVLVVLYVIGG